MTDFVVCGIDMARFSPAQRFFICTTFIVVFFSLNGIVQEYLFGVFHFSHAFFLTFWHFLVYASFSCLQILLFSLDPPPAPDSPDSDELRSASPIPDVAVRPTSSSLSFSLFSRLRSLYRRLLPSQPGVMKYVALLAVLRVIGKTLSNEALVYVDYPTKILFKSSKLLFTMFVGSLFMKRNYTWLDYSASVFFMFGLVSSHIANKKVELIFSPIGYFFMFLALLPDSFAGQTQERLLKDRGVAIPKLVFHSHAIGALFLFSISLLSGEWFEAVSCILEEPLIGILILTHACSGFIAIQFLMSMTKMFGVFTTQTVCTVRKVFTIFLSYLLFPKPFHYLHAVGILLVFSGIGMQLWHKKQKEDREKKERELEGGGGGKVSMNLESSSSSSRPFLAEGSDERSRGSTRPFGYPQKAVGSDGSSSSSSSSVGGREAEV